MFTLRKLATIALRHSRDEPNGLRLHGIDGPNPSFGVGRFTDTAQHSNRAEVVGLGVVFAETTEETDGGGSSIEMGYLVFIDVLPITG